MTTKDRQNIYFLFHHYRYTGMTIAKLYGLSQQRISAIVVEKDITLIPVNECLLCGVDAAKRYFINGDITDERPQNVIMLCEVDERRIKHLQIRKHQGVVVSD